MESLILHLEETNRLLVVKTAIEKVTTAPVHEISTGFVVQFPERGVFVEGADEVYSYCEPEYREEVIAYLGPHTTAIAVSSRPLELTKQVARQIAEAFKCLIDTNFELMLRDYEFLERLRQEPNWNWRPGDH